VHTRIAAVISHSGLSKTAFGQRINISQSMVSLLASGKATPSDRTIAGICREFGVSETWLRTGEGEMFRPALPVDLPRSALASFIGELVLSLPDDKLTSLTQALRAAVPEGGDSPCTRE